MQRTEANKLVSSTFGGAFDRSRYESFIRELLKSFEPKQFTGNRARTGNYIYEPYRDLVESFERIGKFEDADNKTIDILIVRLKPGQKIDRARTKQRNFIAYYLEYGRDDGTTRDAALVAFVEADSKTWRFSLVRMEYEIVRAESGKIKTEKNLSPARRFSFLVGEGENTHTAQARFVPIIEDDSSKPTLETINQAFSVESITEEFFESYRELFHKLCESLESVCKKDSIVRDEFKEKGIEISDFAKKLLGQIVFLYFLQRKGWLGVEERKKWGTGSRNFLRRLFEKEIVDYKNFFNDALEYLFYDMLAVDKGEAAWHEKFNCRIPFLNGGLFEPLFDYDWRKTHILIPNEVFSNRRVETDFDSGSGILDIFDRYNFTVREDEPLEKEVAIDPELLGKVFENLLEVRDRKTKGSYYTPREIVHYMCQESLISYLERQLHGKVSRIDITELIKFGDINVINDSLALSPQKRELKNSKFQTKLPDPIISNADEIDKLLARIKVCDPAVGSGAFPLGMLNEIVRARYNLTPCLYEGELDVDGRSFYDLKWYAIENSIYGVDIDPGAIEIAKLRLWLSLIVDEESLSNIKPLPNLDFKLMQGNSLIEEFEGVRLIEDKLFEQINSEKLREVLQSEINELQRYYFKLMSENKLKSEQKSELERQVKYKVDTLKRLTTRGTEGSRQIALQDKVSIFAALLSQLKELHKKFFVTSHKTEKEKLRQKLNALEWELMEAALDEQGADKSAKVKLKELKRIQTKPFFLWKLQFSEVFQENGGFDVVIGNPPYGIVFDTTFKKAYEGRFPIFKRNNDIFVAFFGLAEVLLNRNSSILCFITPNTYLTGDYYRALRCKLKTEYTIETVWDFKNLPIFNDPTVYVAIVRARFEMASFPYDSTLLVSSESILNITSNLLTFSSSNEEAIRIRNSVVEQVCKKCVSLEEKYLVKDVGFNYWTEGRGKKRGNSIGSRVLYEGKRQHSKDIPFIKGRDIFPYSIQAPSHYLKHNWESFLDPKVDTFRFSEDIMKTNPKLIYRQTSAKLIAAVDRNGYFNDKTVHIIVPKQEDCWFIDPDVLALLMNSLLFNYIYSYYSQEEGGRAFAQVKTVCVKKLPLTLTPVPPRILAHAKGLAENMSLIMPEIDRLIFDWYQIDKISREEIEVWKLNKYSNIEVAVADD